MTRPRTHQTFRRIEYAACAMAFVYALGLTFRHSLTDTDLWWHLKSGERLSAGAFYCGSDPFSFSSPSPLTPAMRNGLKAHWLGQAALWRVYRATGPAGLAVLRGMLLLAPFALVWALLRRRGLRPLAGLSLIAPGALIAAAQLVYTCERPQAFSYLFTAALVALLERGRRGAGIWLAPLMLLWSNCHAGYILGDALLIIAGAGAALAAARARNGAEARFALCAGAAVLCSFVNPAHASLFVRYTLGMAAQVLGALGPAAHSGGLQELSRFIVEYKPLPLLFARSSGFGWAAAYWAFAATAAAAVIAAFWVRRGSGAARLCTAAALIAFANLHAKGVMFSLAPLAWLCGVSMLDIKRLRPRLARALALTPAAIAAVFAASLAARNPAALMPGPPPAWISPEFPAAAASFLGANRAAPEIFNFYDWGGYLIWRLCPPYRVFADGRFINEEAVTLCHAICSLRQGWARQLDSCGAAIAVLPLVIPGYGHILPLSAGLSMDSGWRLVFLHGNSAVFARDIPQNRGVIAAHAMDPRDAFRRIVSIEDSLLLKAPGHPVYSLNKADALAALGALDQAMEIYRRFAEYGGRQRLQQLGGLPQ